MEEIQEKIKKFNEERGWGKTWEIKDLLLNMTEEIGEFWNIIKWVDDKKQEEMIEKNKDEVENFIGDMAFLIVKIASICNVNTKKELVKVIEEYEKRFPIEKMKQFKHGNKKAGGYDGK